MTTREVLIEARRILTPDGAWTQGARARDGEGEPVAECDDTAVCWCVGGAVALAGTTPAGWLDDAWLDAYAALGRPGGDLPSLWNDDPGRTHADVLALLDRAIREAEG